MKIKEGLGKEYKKYVKTNSTNGYSICVVKFSEEWADEMEKEINHGATIKDCAKNASRIVDNRPGYGITGFMYGCAVNGLSHFWIHGDDLKAWHNNEYGQPEAKGVVNPAILCISKKEK